MFINFKKLKDRVDLFSKPALFSYVAFGLTVVFSVAVPLLYQTNDFSYLSFVPMLMFKLVLKNLFLLVVFLQLFKEQATFKLYAKHYIAACVLYVFISLVLITIPDLKDFWISILHMTELDKQLITFSHHFTRVGIDGFASFFQTFLMSIGIILSAYLIVFNEIHNKQTDFRMYISLFVLTVGTLLYGRIGSLVAFATISFLIVYFLLNKRTIKKGLSIIAVISIVFIVLIGLSQMNESIKNWMSWAFDYIINFFSNGSLISQSIEEMLNMYFVPDIKTILLGDGYYTDPITGSYYESVDIGFLRNLLFFGLIPTIVGYISLVSLLIGFMKIFKLKDDKAGILFVVAALLTIVLFELKGGAYYFMYPILLPYYLLLSSENKTVLKDESLKM